MPALAARPHRIFRREARPIDLWCRSTTSDIRARWRQDMAEVCGSGLFAACCSVLQCVLQCLLYCVYRSRRLLRVMTSQSNRLVKRAPFHWWQSRNETVTLWKTQTHQMVAAAKWAVVAVI